GQFLVHCGFHSATTIVKSENQDSELGYLITINSKMPVRFLQESYYDKSFAE
ncbi:hypothetical protein M378DRAFT_159750, partial [Amanita muscaria Koide BX008]